MQWLPDDCDDFVTAAVSAAAIAADCAATAVTAAAAAAAAAIAVVQALETTKLKLHTELLSKDKALTRKLFLFDFNGTLGLKKGKRLRPGIEKLKLLLAAGHEIGIWSSAALKNIPIAKMVSEHDLHFSEVLTGDDCEKPTYAYRKEHNLDPWDKIKPVKKRFPDRQVVIVDDTPSKIPTEDRHLLRPIRTWDGTINDEELTNMVTKLLNEGAAVAVSVARPKIVLLYEPEMSDDSRKRKRIEDAQHTMREQRAKATHV